MSITWRKIWRDLLHNKSRTVLAVISTAVGIFALGLVFGMADTLSTRLDEDYRASQPAHINLYPNTGFGDEVLETIRYEDGIADADSRLSSGVKWKLEGESDWRNGSLAALDDYGDQKMDLVYLEEGAWPAVSVLAVEKQTAPYFNIPIGSTIVIKTSGRDLRLPVTGIVRDPLAYTPQFGGNASFFVAPDTFARIAGYDSYSSISVQMTQFSEEGAVAMVEQLTDRLEGMGMKVGYHSINDPYRHFLHETVDAIMLVLVAMGWLALALAGFLIINTLNALIAQQLWQIGVLKTIGATTGRVIRLYLTIAIVYGGLAVCLAVPLSALATYPLLQWLLAMFNVPLEDYHMTSWVVGLQVGVGLIVPMLAALVPVIGGARATVNEALSSQGLGGKFGKGVLDRVISHIRGLPRPLALSLRNTFRRKARVVLTLITLLLGGLMFIVVMSAGNSLNNSVQMLMSDLGLDVMMTFEYPYRSSTLQNIALSVPGVSQVEIWDVQGATLELENGESILGQLWGVPRMSKIFNPRIVAGRNLLPDDEYAILLNQKIASDEGFAVGDEVMLKIGDREVTWTIVGLILNLNNRQHDNFVPYETLVRETGIPNRGSFAMMLTEAGSDPTLLIDRLQAAYEARNIKVGSSLGAQEFQKQTGAQFEVVITLLLIMAVLAAVVGSLGLASTMSINVVERTREIGVMRAIGASSPMVAGIFVVEGVILGVLSWLLVLLPSYPASYYLSNVVGVAMLGAEGDFDYSLRGALLWLIIVVILSALASLWPAWKATRISVRESLTYE